MLNLQNNLKRNPKSFWTFINKKRKECGLPSSMFFGDKLSNDTSSTCNLFADSFSCVFKDKQATEREISVALRNVPSDAVNLSNIAISEDDVHRALSKLKSSTAAGPDGIPSLILKKFADALCGPLKSIFNKSISESTFPEKWKKSIMFPAYKKGDRRDIANYRGVTSLCAGSKLLEIIVGAALLREVKSYIVIDQHGFFPGRSITTNLAQFTSECLKGIDEGAQMDTVYTDLKAAFDRVDHQLLLAKLRRLGIGDRIACWLKSNLVGRRLSVKLGNVESCSFTQYLWRTPRLKSGSIAVRYLLQ